MKITKIETIPLTVNIDRGVGKVENKVVCSAVFTVVLPHIINYYKVKG